VSWKVLCASPGRSAATSSSRKEDASTAGTADPPGLTTSRSACRSSKRSRPRASRSTATWRPGSPGGSPPTASCGCACRRSCAFPVGPAGCHRSRLSRQPQAPAAPPARPAAPRGPGGLAAVSIQNSRLVEERLRAERTQVIGQVARAVVHDLRSPLSSIRGLAELLHERAPQEDPSRPHLATIMAEADRLTGSPAICCSSRVRPRPSSGRRRVLRTSCGRHSSRCSPACSAPT